MPYFAVDDGFHSHPKTVRLGFDMAGLAAAGLWSKAGSWSSSNGTDGWIPPEVVDMLAPGVGRKLAERLVKVRLWEPAQRDDETGWQFHDWTGEEDGVRRNYTRAETLKRRQDWAERQTRARARKKGSTDNESPDVTRDSQSDSRSDSRVESRNGSRVTHGESHVVSHGVPVPSPLPSPKNHMGVQVGESVLDVDPPAGAREYVPDSHHTRGEEKPTPAKQRPRIRCPEGHGEQIWNCLPCGNEHGDRRFYANPANWREIDRTSKWTAPDYARLRAFVGVK